MLGVPPYSDTADGLYRAYLTPAYCAAQEAVAGWMAEAGMAVRRDPAANLVGRYEGGDPSAPILLIGSHLDSVRGAGRYDGPLGIMLGIEAVDALCRAGRRLPFAVEVIAFGDEEGSRFPAAMLSSRAVAGTLDRAALDIADADGVTLAAAGADIAHYLEAARPPGSVRAYFEAHIEQGPVLEAEGLAVGTVTGIAAQLRYRVTVSGTAGHAGTTAMDLRSDALAGAAEMICAIENLAQRDQSDLVATVGAIEVAPGAANVVPGRVDFSLDVRSGKGSRRDRVAAAILECCEDIARHRGLRLAYELLHDLPASPCDGRLMDLLDESVAAEGFPVRRLVSGAGHDAMIMASLAPTAMLFLRCAGGVSHNPAEQVDAADADIALRVIMRFLEKMADDATA
ncbi:allantoate amidohydrolase [Sphingopyxis sp.]|uniref:allantoate amidohydrolase n=1 Tax=Sphingopyxis sp. TaxID=1908224 RepID=UPI002ED7DA27